jgi:hypothetical protein
MYGGIVLAAVSAAPVVLFDIPSPYDEEYLKISTLALFISAFAALMAPKRDSSRE